MPTFSNAQGFIINGGEFMDNSLNTTTILSGPSGIDLLREASYPEAAHDADSREYSPRCFPGTRKRYIRDIINWDVPTLGGTPTPIYWMEGPAGAGKSAIAQTCAEELNDQNKLGAAFFFSVSGCKKPGQFFPSIAYQLSTIYPQYHDLISAKIRRDKTLIKKTMSSQFRQLISQPLRELEAQGKGIGTRIAVIIDGLDECEGAGADIIRIIAKAAVDGILPLCWAFFSRPEPQIEAAFAESAVSPHCYKVILPISRDSDGEIELYLRSGLEGILKRRNASTESQWPSSEDMEILVDGASGSFIYATMVLRYVDHVGSLVPQKRLRAIIDTILDRRKRDPKAGTSLDAPFAELDAFYTLILQCIPTEIFPNVQLLLALICRWEFLGAILAANILGMTKDEFEAVCNHTSAIVHFQEPGRDLKLDPSIETSWEYTQVNRDVRVKIDRQVDREVGGQVSFYHRSFGDFLLDPARSGTYCAKGSELLAKLLDVHFDDNQSYSRAGSVTSAVIQPVTTNAPACAPRSSAVQLLRSYSPRGADHFYTADGPEMLRATTDLDYRSEDSPGLIFPTQVQGTIPLYRAYSGVSDHFYTTDKQEMDRATSTLGYSAEGITGYVYSTPQCGAIPLYRAYHPRMTNHFYTSDPGEWDNAIRNLGYVGENIAAYVLPLPSPPPPTCEHRSSAVQLLRSYSPRGVNNFYTADGPEMLRATTNLDYRSEDSPGLIFPTQVQGTVPLYRAFSSQIVDHFYTTDKPEMDRATSLLPFSAEGITGYVYPTPQCGAIPLYRAYHERLYNHFYTSNVGEWDNLVRNMGYKGEGIAGYVLPL